MIKTCSKCLEKKNISDFFTRKTSKGIKPRSACKICTDIRNRVYMDDNRDIYNKSSKKSSEKWRKNNPKKWSEISCNSQKQIRQSVIKILREFKISKGCAKCGYKDNVFALQFDHIIPRIDTSKHWKTPENYTQAKIVMEDSNIQVLCANCHCIKTQENKDYLKRG